MLREFVHWYRRAAGPNVPNRFLFALCRTRGDHRWKDGPLGFLHCSRCFMFAPARSREDGARDGGK